MSLAPGTRLGPYEILTLLGSGGMGEVYRARDTRLGRDVGIKVLPAALANDAPALARFEREARTVAALNHPNIVTLHSIEEAAGVRFLTLEYVEGENLARLVLPGGLPLAKLIGIACALADALAAAHEKGIVHRDLKPANVMVTASGRVKVLDFGIAKLLAPGGTQPTDPVRTLNAVPVTGTGAVLGTVPYMAPEQLGGAPVDARTDLFALGIVLYELATGRHPFAGETLSEVGAAILRDTPAPVTALRPDLPPGLAGIVSRCLEKNPRARYQSAHEVHAALDSLRREAVSGAAQAAIPAPFAEATPSIAVLPFLNLSPDPENEYFADGLSEELLNVLAKIRGLRVVSRTSAFSFKGSKLDLATVATRLNVATVLEGSVRKSGRRVRVAAQLIHVATDSHLWSETYDREIEDIFAVQDDIARSVVKELRAALLGDEPDSAAEADVRAEVAAAVKGRAVSAEAHRLYLEGRFFVDRQARDAMTRGIDCLKQALAADPEYPLAWAVLARAYFISAGWSWVPLAEGYELAREAAEKALALEPDLPEALVALGGVRMMQEWKSNGKWNGGGVWIRRALELAPGNADVVRAAALFEGMRGRLDDAIALDRRAVALDPVSAAPYRNLGYHCLEAGLLAEAESAIRKLLDLSPQSSYARYLLGFVFLAQGRTEEALAAFGQEPPTEVTRVHGLALAYHAAGRREEAAAALAELVQNWAQDNAYQIAQACAYHGETELAFAWLERAYAERDPGLTEARVDFLLRNVHRDPRWLPFLEKMGLAD